ncbi:amino acid ABC transporter ATP-binding/permease protein [Umezawaea endophytica]|uniref:ATP-binding cassette domain-containing protein n=1 Tax=Umezawaea endophytica TaxID=1654476 RepID=A0A9X3A1K9_9PSEU|nr:ATP-binding cassette domain-containing protein [Umezawaea endophytica]MCS7479774.1 ATP-binding cassette domain-containing protein [Umezawaea endophytica]
MKRLALAAFAATLAELSGVALTATAVWLVVRAADQPPMAALTVAVVAVRALALSRGALRYAERLAGHDAVLRHLADLRGRVYESLLRQPVQRRGGDLVTRLVSDVDAVQDVVLRCLLPACAAGLVGAVAVLVVPALVLPVLLLGVVLPLAAFSLADSHLRALAPLRSRLAERTVALVHGAAELTAFGVLDDELARSGRVITDIATREHRATTRTGALTAVAVLIQFGTALALLSTGAPAPVVLGAVAVLEVFLPLTTAAQRWAETRGSLTRVRELLTARRPVPALTEDLPPGTRLAVVGPSGAGKTTLLSRFAVPDARGALADAHVFHTTVRANVLLAKPDATQEELDFAAHTTDLDLPWDLVVGEHGTALSGGQRQRLILTRAVLSTPPVLLLDEPVEGLPPTQADQVLHRVLSTAPSTVVLITHRLTPLAHEHFDEILVLDNGVITQRGTHATLVTTPGYYRDRWKDETSKSEYRNSYR